MEVFAVMSLIYYPSEIPEGDSAERRHLWQNFKHFFPFPITLVVISMGFVPPWELSREIGPEISVSSALWLVNSRELREHSLSVEEDKAESDNSDDDGRSQCDRLKLPQLCWIMHVCLCSFVLSTNLNFVRPWVWVCHTRFQIVLNLEWQVTQNYLWQVICEYLSNKAKLS
jgi:hypothetical protein